MSFKRERLRSARELKNLTQKEVAAILGKKDNTISNWENGEARPDVETLAILCKLYEINPDSLFDDYDDSEDVILNLSDNEKSLIKVFRKLDQKTQEYFLFSINKAAEMFEKKE